MSSTIVIQSHRSPLPWPWIETCLATVRDWSMRNSYQYRFIGDELFEYVTGPVQKKTECRPVVRSDLARLLVLRDALQEFERVVWLDADFLIFDAASFVLPETSYAVGREVWVQHNHQNKIKTYKKVHNALLMFCRGNSFLNFYIDTAQRMLLDNSGTIPAQFIGPKLLTALHNVALLPVMETAGMLSPLVILDILSGHGPALAAFNAKSPRTIAGANLCISSCENNALSAVQVEQVIQVLLQTSGRGHACRLFA